MKNAKLLAGLLMLAASALAACTDADREAMFSGQRAPLVGRCDPQAGYPPPSQRPGCDTAQYGKNGYSK